MVAALEGPLVTLHLATEASCGEQLLDTGLQAVEGLADPLQGLAASVPAAVLPPQLPTQCVSTCLQLSTLINMAPCILSFALAEAVSLATPGSGSPACAASGEPSWQPPAP